MKFSTFLVTVALSAARVRAATALTDTQMLALQQNNGLDLAFNYAPVFFFSQALNKPPTYPTWAFNGSLTQPDIYTPEHQTLPAPQCKYPDVGCKSRNPGVPKNTQSPEFPIYYTWTQCSPSEIRVVYNLYYQKDGAKFLFVDTGHEHDWERVIIVHTRGTDGLWRPGRMLASAHREYNQHSWGDIQNTLSHADATSGLGPTPNGLRSLDHPKIYIAWSKHGMYHDRKTTFLDVISQSTDNAYRGQDWWRFVGKQYYVYSDRGSEAGAALEAVGWGSAVSDPVEVWDGVCLEGA